MAYLGADPGVARLKKKIGILSIRGPEVSLGSHGVGTRRGQTPTPHAPGLPSVETYQYILSASHRAWAQVRQLFDPELSGEHQAAAHAA